MKTLIVHKEADFNWLRRLFPDRSPLLASVCNKPLLEYLLDFAILSGSRHVRLATDMPLVEVEAVFGDGSRWGVELTYVSIREADDLEAVLLKEIEVSASFAHVPSAWPRALRMMAKGQVQTEPLATNVFALSDWRQAFDRFEAREGLKNILVPE